MKKLLFLPLCLLSVVLMAQTTNADYLAYIEAYKQAAVNQELTYKIPASITLAQGLLESGAGKSPLAKEANNHFGIKCHSDWTGATFTQDDDAVGECFRKYDSAEQSYEDHAKFLLKPRYQKLFSLPITDYKGWARGLKECGYATDPNYAPKLIKLIEDYDLVAITEATKYSKESKKVEETVKKTATTTTTATSTTSKPKRSRSEARKKANQEVDGAFQKQSGAAAEVEEQVAKSFRDRKINPSQVAAVDLYVGHTVQHQGLRKYVVAQPGDTYVGIAAEFNIELRRILRYNHAGKYDKLTSGKRVYLNCKAPKK